MKQKKQKTLGKQLNEIDKRIAKMDKKNTKEYLKEADKVVKEHGRIIRRHNLLFKHTFTIRQAALYLDVSLKKFENLNQTVFGNKNTFNRTDLDEYLRSIGAYVPNAKEFFGS